MSFFTSLNLIKYSHLFRTCKKIIANINSLELPKLLRNLSIVNPSGLFAGSECLTYVDNG